MFYSHRLYPLLGSMGTQITIWYLPTEICIYVVELLVKRIQIHGQPTLLMSGQRPTAPCSFALAQPVQQIMTLLISASADNAHSQSEPTNRRLSEDNITPSRFPYWVVPKKNNQHLVTVPFLVQNDVHFLESHQHLLMGTLLG